MKVALVTGAGRGIGAAVAEALAARGIIVVLAVRDVSNAVGVVTAIEGSHNRAINSPGKRVVAIQCEVADPVSAQDAVATTLADFGRLDILVNNAGVIEPIGRITDTPPSDWARAITINLVGAFHMIYAALPSMLGHSGGTIVNLSSGAAHAPREGWSAYCASKAGLAMLTRSIHLEYGAQNVAAYGLQPGLVDTGMQTIIRASGINEISRVPQAELAPAARSAGVIAWLADSRPDDLRGQDLRATDPALSERVAKDVASR